MVREYAGREPRRTLVPGATPPPQAKTALTKDAIATRSRIFDSKVLTGRLEPRTPRHATPRSAARHSSVLSLRALRIPIGFRRVEVVLGDRNGRDAPSDWATG